MKFKTVLRYIRRQGFVAHPLSVSSGARHTQEGVGLSQKRSKTKRDCCPLCGQANKTRKCDPETGKCAYEIACAQRRAELDDATIKFLGLIRRKKDEKRPRKPPKGREK